MYYEFSALRRNRIAAVLQTEDLPDFGTKEREIKKERKEKAENRILKRGGGRRLYCTIKREQDT
jgi:hypothetical protein